MKSLLAAILVGTSCFAQVQPAVDNLEMIVAKRVVIQRMPLCEPGTFKAVLDYAGMQAKVISLKPSTVPQVSKATLERMPPAARDMIEDEQKAATILVQFDDSKRLDTCGPVSPKRLPNYLEVAPGEKLQPVASKPKFIITGQLQQPQTSSAPSVTPQTTANPLVSSHVPATPQPQGTGATVSQPTANTIAPPANPVATQSAGAGNTAIQPASPSGVTTLVSAPTKSSAHMLSDTEVNAALSGNGRNHYVTILDVSLNPLTPTGKRLPSITLFMPEALLASAADSARKQFMHVELTEEQKRRSLTVFAEGYVGEKITDGCVSITRIVLLSDQSGSSVQEAYLSQPMDETWRNAFGATNNCQTLEAKFFLEDVQKIKDAAPNGEFFIAVFAGSTNTKMYKIKRKHQVKLGL
jgi:hypothetical protein